MRKFSLSLLALGLSVSLLGCGTDSGNGESSATQISSAPSSEAPKQSTSAETTGNADETQTSEPSAEDTASASDSVQPTDATTESSASTESSATTESTETSSGGVSAAKLKAAVQAAVGRSNPGDSIIGTFTPTECGIAVDLVSPNTKNAPWIGSVQGVADPGVIAGWSVKGEDPAFAKMVATAKSPKCQQITIATKDGGKGTLAPTPITQDLGEGVTGFSWMLSSPNSEALKVTTLMWQSKGVVVTLAAPFKTVAEARAMMTKIQQGVA